MIVDTMTHEEVYAELEREREAVTTWWTYKLISFRRAVLKAPRLPLERWVEYQSARRNKYVFYTRIYDRKMRRILTGMSVMRQTKEGLTAYTTWLDHQRLISPMVLTPHMFKRYAERAGVDKSGAELVKHYFMHNAHGCDTQNQRIMARSVRWNGQEHQASCVAQGVLLGQLEGDLFIARTFITYDMTSGLQAQEFARCRRNILTDEELYQRALIMY